MKKEKSNQNEKPDLTKQSEHNQDIPKPSEQKQDITKQNEPKLSDPKDSKGLGNSKNFQSQDPKDKRIEDLIDTLQRLQAEFENYKKYVERYQQDLRKYAAADLIGQLLQILDSFELALKHTDNKETLCKGVELIYSQFYSLLEKQGLKKITANGKLDPNIHEVLLKEESDKEEDTIIEELQKGYMLGDKVLRHSKVKVSKHKQGNKK